MSSNNNSLSLPNLNIEFSQANDTTNVVNNNNNATGTDSLSLPNLNIQFSQANDTTNVVNNNNNANGTESLSLPNLNIEFSQANDNHNAPIINNQPFANNNNAHNTNNRSTPSTFLNFNSLRQIPPIVNQPPLVPQQRLVVPHFNIFPPSTQTPPIINHASQTHLLPQKRSLIPSSQIRPPQPKRRKLNYSNFPVASTLSTLMERTEFPSMEVLNAQAMANAAVFNTPTPSIHSSAPSEHGSTTASIYSQQSSEHGSTTTSIYSQQCDSTSFDGFSYHESDNDVIFNDFEDKDEARRRKYRRQKRNQRAKATKQQKDIMRKYDRNRKKRKRDALTEAELIIMQRREAVASAKHRRRCKTTSIFRMENGIESFDNSKVTVLYLGEPTHICPSCSAKYWKREVEYIGKNDFTKFSKCCGKGKYALHDIPEPPEYLRNLWENPSTPDGAYFHDHIRGLNCALSMAFLQCRQITFPSGVQVFKINGMVHNRAPTIVPEDEDEKQQFAQIYILDPERQIDLRSDLNGLMGEKGEYKHRARAMLSRLQKLLMKTNHLIQCYRNAYNITKEQHIPEVAIEIQNDLDNAPTRTYQAPTCNEIAVVIPTAAPSGVTNRKITLSYKKGGWTTISETNCLYEAFQYVLFFPNATPSWPLGIKKAKGLNYYFYCHVKLNQQCTISRQSDSITVLSLQINV